MGWKEEPRLRFQYTSDGSSEMSWQPTAVYAPDKPENSIKRGASHKEDAGDVFLFFSSAIIAALAYQYVSYIDYVRHLPVLSHNTVMGLTIVVSFLGAMALFSLKAIQVFAKASVVGLCVAYLLYL